MPTGDRNVANPQLPKQQRELDPECLKEYAKGVLGSLGGGMTSAMIYLGDRFGLYTKLSPGGERSALFRVV